MRKHDLKDRCERLRSHIIARQYATEGEVAEHWPEPDWPKKVSPATYLNRWPEGEHAKAALVILSEDLDPWWFCYAALGRINGLPSRVVTGLAYVPFFGRKDDIFGYHLWTQFLIDGEWVDYDAALRESDCSPIRIAFAVSSLRSAGMADLSLPLLNRIGAIELDVVKIEPKK